MQGLRCSPVRCYGYTIGYARLCDVRKDDDVDGDVGGEYLDGYGVVDVLAVALSSWNLDRGHKSNSTPILAAGRVYI